MSRDSFSHRVRPRVGGLLIEQQSILLVLIQLPTRNAPVWMPPGGEVHFGEPLTDALEREFSEETGLNIEPRALAYVYDFIQTPYHAIEHYFLCGKIGGTLKTGADPELDSDTQIIKDIRFHPLSRLNQLTLEPMFLQDRLADDWQTDRLQRPRWIGTNVE